MTAVFVPGRPAWAADEPVEVQRLIVENSLTALQLRALREFATAELDSGTRAVRKISHSLALALRKRGFGELTGTYMPGKLDRSHPVATFELNDTGWAVAQRTIVIDECPMGCHEADADHEYMKRDGRWDRQPKPPREKSPRHHPPEWDE